MVELQLSLVQSGALDWKARSVTILDTGFQKRAAPQCQTATTSSGEKIELLEIYRECPVDLKPVDFDDGAIAGS